MSTDQKVTPEAQPEAQPEILPPVDTGVEAITELKTSTTDDPDLPAMSTRTLHGGVKETVINPKKFIESVFYGLEIPNGTYKGEKISPQLINEVEKTGDELLALTLEEMFDGDNAAKCKSFQNDVTARIQSPVNTKASKLKKPVNEFKKIILDLPKQALGRIPEIHEAMLAKNKQYKAEKEKRERETSQKDAAWQEETTKKLIEVSGLVGTLASSPSGEVQKTLDTLESDDFEPHKNFADQYADTVAGAKNTLGVMLESKIIDEAEAKEKAEAEKKAQAERDAELKKLQAEKVEQKLKDAANQALMDITALYAETVGGNSSTLDKAHKKINDLSSSLEANDYFDKEKADNYLDRISLELKATVKMEKEAAEILAKEKSAAKKEEAEAEEKARLRLIEENTELVLDAGYTLFNDDPDNSDYADYRKAGRVLISEDALSRVNKEYLLDAIEKTEKQIRRDKEVKIERTLREIEGFVEEARSMAFSKEVKSRFLDGSLASYRADEFGSNEKVTEAISKAIEEIEGIAETMRIEESKAEQEYTANLVSAKKEMSQAILSLGTHEEIIAAIIDGSIPHVKFEVEV